MIPQKWLDRTEPEKVEQKLRQKELFFELRQSSPF